jgi:hypothetical protein
MVIFEGQGQLKALIQFYLPNQAQYFCWLCTLKLDLILPKI